ATRRSSVSGPSTRKRHGSVRWWFGAQRASSSSCSTTAPGTGSAPYALCVLRVRIAVSTSTSGEARPFGQNGSVMQSQGEPRAGARVRLGVEVPAEDVHHAVAHATSDLAARVKVPGFRVGKVPAQVLLQRVGRQRVFSEAVESHIGGWFWNAAAQSRVQPV